MFGTDEVKSVGGWLTRGLTFSSRLLESQEGMRESPKNRAIPRSPTIPPTSAHPHTGAVEGPLSPHPISFLSHHLRSAFKARP